MYICQESYVRTRRTAGRLRLRTAVCLALIGSCSANARGLPTSAQDGLLTPTTPGLIPIHLPRAADMEPAVREQLAAAQNSLAAATKNPDTRSDKLADAYGTLGDLYHAYALNAPAIECYVNASRLAPKDFRWVYLLGKLYEKQGDAQKAVSHYDTVLKLRANYLPVFESLGNVYLQLNRVDEAEHLFRRALESDRANAAAEYGLGQAALSRRSYPSAIKHLENALTLAPEANRLHYSLAMAYRGVGEIEKAQSHLVLSGPVGVRESDPLIDRLQDLIKGVRLHLVRGRAAIEARRYSEAADEFRRAIREQPESVPAHFNLGAALSQMGDLLGAAREFEEALRLDPGHANAHYNLGLLLAQAERHHEAIEHLRSAVDVSPNDNNARFLLAQELTIVRRLDEAEAELSRIVESDPDNEDALLGRVKILLGQQQYSRALQALDRGHAQFPRKHATTAALTNLLARSPQVDLRDGKRAHKLARGLFEVTGTIDHSILVAMALAELERCDEAAAWLRQVIARASTERRHDILEKLKAELSSYETARPCRPIGITSQAPIR